VAKSTLGYGVDKAFAPGSRLASYPDMMIMGLHYFILVGMETKRKGISATEEIPADAHRKGTTSRSYPVIKFSGVSS
jgi:hypothetical protein